MSRAESLFWSIARQDQGWVKFEGYRRTFITREALESRMRRGLASREPIDSGRGRKPAARPNAQTTERRDGYYLGTEQRHTDVDGVPLSPSGKRWEWGLPPDRRREAFVIQHVSGGPVKIGYSINPEILLETLNLSTHDQGYRLLAIVPGGDAAERDLHVRFRHLRIHGKWFLFELEVQAFVESVVSEAGVGETTPQGLQR
jgi:hypothetical protein